MLKKPYLAKSTTSEQEIVFTYLDPAVDYEASDLRQYFKTHDKAHLVIHPGATPVKFHIRALSRPRINKIRLQAHADVEQEDGSIPSLAFRMAIQARAFKEGCTKITDCPVTQEDGSERLEELQPYEALEFMDPQVIEDVGERILGISTLGLSGGRAPGK